MTFYGHFAAAYGTCWLAIMVVALVTTSHIDVGMFGLIGFPVIGAIYAFVRIGSDGSGSQDEREIDWLRRRVVELESRLESSPYER